MRFILRCNAFLTNPSLTQGYFETIYGQKISMDLILRMNPATPDLCCILDEDLIEYWQGIRKLAAKSLRSIPIADYMVRLEVYGELYEIFREKKLYGRLIELLEVVANETEAIYSAHYEGLRMERLSSPIKPIYEA